MQQSIGRGHILAVLALAASLAGCTMSDASPGEQQQALAQQGPAEAGIAHSFDAPLAVVKQAAIGAMQGMQMPPAKVQDVQDAIVLQVPPLPGASNDDSETGRVVIEKANLPPYVVRVVYGQRDAIAFSDAETSFARDLYQRMSQILGSASTN